jgi:hypothetical protein
MSDIDELMTECEFRQSSMAAWVSELQHRYTAQMVAQEAKRRGITIYEKPPLSYMGQGSWRVGKDILIHLIACSSVGSDSYHQWLFSPAGADWRKNVESDYRCAEHRRQGHISAVAKWGYQEAGA